MTKPRIPYIELQLARAAAGLTQKALAKRLNVDQSRVSRLESGDHPRPRLLTINKIAQALQCDYRVLLPGTADCPTCSTTEKEAAA